jgi:cytochrome c peroxidase
MFSKIFSRAVPQFTRQTMTPRVGKFALGAMGLATMGLATNAFADDAVNYNQVREDIADILDNESHDDGSMGPIFVRLAWHASGTYDKNVCNGGSDGATMRFRPESDHGANAGLALARNSLEAIKAKHPGISYGDLWTLAGAVSIEQMGGPKINWRPGRTDKDASACTPDGRLPDAAQGADHVRDIFYRMGFNDQEIVALVGSHCLGRCHTTRSGFDGPWTRSPTTFSNTYFTELLENDWDVKKWNGPTQFEDKTGDLMMLPADMVFKTDPEFRKWSEKYAKDEQLFFKHFSSAFTKLEELGVDFPNETSYVPFALLAAMGVAAARY